MQNGASDPGQQWQYTSGSTAADSRWQPSYEEYEVEPLEISWKASEFISREKTALWFVVLGLGAAVLALAVFFLTGRSYFSSVTIGIVALLFGIVSVKKPRELEYHIGADGIRIGGKLYPYQTFKAFALTQEGSMPSIVLLPLGRLMPPISMYFSINEAPDIIDALEQYLPEDEHRHDTLDRFLRRIRF